MANATVNRAGRSPGWALWLDARGQFSWLRFVTLLALLAPAIVAGYDTAMGNLGARPITEVIHRSGLWMVRFLFLSMLVTPVRRSWRWPELLDIRRMLGVGCFCYGVAHISLYIVDENFDLGTVASEIVLRIYLTIGAVALLGLGVLAATSTDGMVKRLGAKNWQRLHMAIYGIAVLGIIHYFMQSKLEVTEPTVFAGFLGWLLIYRLVVAFMDRRSEPSPYLIAGLSLIVPILTALGEAGYFNILYHAPIIRVLQADLGLRTGIRPAWWVLIFGAIVTTGMIYRRLTTKSRARPTPRAGAKPQPNPAQ
ncbi:MAG TPA: protein-methionine-sulfoxide reductase heme-binding subunit MsrQ [Stellaceae bacterium]|nr:protein-methionine-sulfoxide reductase heme-binding subunit MsrQ [Stellaceae bacterium]